MNWRSKEFLPATTSLAGILLGALLYAAGAGAASSAVWALVVAGIVGVQTLSLFRSPGKRRQGVDVIAFIAMAGALILGQYFAGAIIALMLAGGQALEVYATGRAGRDLAALVERAPRDVHRYENRSLVDRNVSEVGIGDLLWVRAGEIIPVDGVVASGVAILDESTLTGESRLVERLRGQRVYSGTLNGGSPFDLRATAAAADSTYAGIVRLVQQAQDSKSPLVRLADRYARLFLPLTFLMAALAWLVSGDPVRVLAVLVVATPCPLILAAPVAMISGVSRAARYGVIMKGGGALEALSRVRTLLLDKTGTLTVSSPVLSDIEVFDSHSSDDLLRLAASVGQASPHVLSIAMVSAARHRRLTLAFPTSVHDEAGMGVRGTVEGQLVAIGRGDWVARNGALLPAVRRIRRRTALEGSSHVFVAVDGVLAGAVILDSPIRPETPGAIRLLRRAGIQRVVVLTGDHPDQAEVAAAAIGADEALAERSPADKAEAAQAESARAATAMVGDGINDAPALAAATVGVAMGAMGATASSQAADVVLMVDRLDRLVDALRIAQRTRRIALQSIIAGMCLSFAGMVAAVAGGITPLAGALLQEAIDIAVILNALRALWDDSRAVPDDGAVRERSRVLAEHDALLPKVKRLRAVADTLDVVPAMEARARLAQVQTFLVEELLPHERLEDGSMYPLVAKLMGGDNPTGTMSRAHLEISHLTRLLGRFVEDLPPEGPIPPEDLRDLRRVLYGLDALLRLHFAQEEEQYLTLLDSHTDRDLDNTVAHGNPVVMERDPALR